MIMILRNAGMRFGRLAKARRDPLARTPPG
jgi:hypothetical protein